jgi:hypothetical protein
MSRRDARAGGRPGIIDDGDASRARTALGYCIAYYPGEVE